MTTTARPRRTACPLDCPDLCALEVTVAPDGAGGERVAKVAAGEGTPLTAGIICGKVRNIADHVHGDHRVRTPLVRHRGELRPASWDAALELVAGRLAEIRARVGGEAILPFHYGGSNGWLTEGALASRFFRRLGATHLLGSFCALPTGAAQSAMFGDIPSAALEDLEHSELVILWGVNPSASGIHLVPILDRVLARGGTLIVVDPRRTPLARRAHLHLAPRPGTDLPLALAAIGHLFSTGRADRAFLAAHTVGADVLEARAAAWPLPAAADVCGVPAAQIAELAERLVRARPAMVRAGWGLERTRNGCGAAAAVMALPAVAGAFGVRGGGLCMSNGHAGWGVSKEAAIGAPPPTTRQLNMVELGRALDPDRGLRDPAIEAVFVYNCNPVATAPDQLAVRRGLARPDVLTIVHDAVMTDTAALADVVLPATTFLEHREIRRGYGAMRLYDSPPVIAPIGQARSNNALFAELLARLGLARPGEPTTDAELADAIFAGPRGAELRAQLRDHGGREPARRRRAGPRAAGGSAAGHGQRQDRPGAGRARGPRAGRALRVSTAARAGGVPAGPDLAGAVDDDQLHVRPAAHRARRARAGAGRRRGARHPHRRPGPGLERARRGPLRGGGHGRAPRWHRRVAERSLGPAHRQRRHRQRPHPRHRRRSGRRRLLQ
jgi:anaerobic selenocysteine-containing dehydrogenase